jgi:sphinganine-1-phosphate aldolase
MLIPEKGRHYDEILNDMAQFGKNDADFRSGKTWSLVYYLTDQHTEFLKQAHGMYISENGLNPMAFESLKRFESEVIRMTATMLNANPEEACGTMTSGGTESCLLAVKTARDRARRKRPWIRNPEMIVPDSVHVAFEKGAEYFGVKAVHAPCDETGRVDVRAVRRKLTRNTVLLVGSAPCYPYGAVDPIEELGRLAQKKDLPLHVDSCLGGFLLPFVERLGSPVPLFDFRVPGVTSMSADVHKYGFSAKGASTIIYRNADYLRDQIFVCDYWPGGVFASPALLGTRPGGSIAAAWASLQAQGQSGLLDNARQIMAVSHKLQDGINRIKGLKVFGRPHMSVFAYCSTEAGISIYAVGDQMEKSGWHVDRNQRPEALHVMVTPHHGKVADAYLEDLRVAVETVRANPELALSGKAPTYGMIAHIPLRRLVKANVLQMMLDLYGPRGQSISLEDGGGSDLATRAGLLFLRFRDRVRKQWHKP